MDYKISVIVPCYNSEKFLKETLDNLLGQTLKEIQIITVNDGSTDSTADIIAEYAAKDSRILSVYQENAGVSAARNNGIGHAEGKYMIFLDSDDLFGENAFETMYATLEEANADLAICRAVSFGYGAGQFNPIVDSFVSEKNIDCYDKRLLWNFIVSNKCYRTSLIKQSGVLFPPLRYSEDGAFFMQFIHKTMPTIIGVYDAVFKYRKHQPNEGLSVTQRCELELVKDFSASHELIYNAVSQSFGDGLTEENKNYLDEILCKKLTALINEFYRSLWSGDDETLECIKSVALDAMSRMSDEAKKKFKIVTKDIGEPVFSKAEIAGKPFVTVIAKNPTNAFINSLYAQSMPIFELITAESNTLPDHKNIVVLPEKNFASAAKADAKGKITVKLSGNQPLDLRFLKVISLLKRSSKFGILPDFVIKIGAMLFLKIKK